MRIRWIKTDLRIGLSRCIYRIIRVFSIVGVRSAQHKTLFRNTSYIGNAIVNVVLRPSSLSTAKVPPCPLVIMS